MTAEFASAIDKSLPPLDTVLSVATMDAAPAPWRSNGEVWVVPLPLQILGVVPIKRKNVPAARIPIWAASYFMPQDENSKTVFESVCIGHEEAIRALLQQVLRVGEYTTLKMSVREANLSIAEAEETIVENRPMPGSTTHFAPPYWFDWAGLR